MVGRFAYLKLGLSVVLVLVGVKMLATDLWHVPVWVSLVAIAAVLGVSIEASRRRPLAARTSVR